MILALNKHRLLVGVGVLLLVLVTLGLALRQTLAGLAINHLLSLAGASRIEFSVAHATPWHVMVEDLGFQIKTQPYGAKRVTMLRDHWWTPSFGRVRVEQALVPLTIDGSDSNPWKWSTYRNGAAAGSTPALPVEEISLDGQLIIQAAGQPAQALSVTFEARPTETGWTGRAEVVGPGIAAKGEGSFDPVTGGMAFTLPEISFDLQPWQGFVQRLILLPGGGWEMAGRFTGHAEGRWEDNKLVVGGEVHLREGRAEQSRPAIRAEGIEADLEFTDFDKFITRPGTLRIREVHTGQLTLGDVQAEFAFAGPDLITVSQASLSALGGRVTTEPFEYRLSARDFEAMMLVDGISVEEVMALTKDLPARASGRVDGRFPVRIDDGGLRIGTGWLALKPGVYAEIQFNAKGLLTRGTATNSPTYAVLQKVESGLLKLKINEMRLDIRPPNAPPGRSAQLHLSGAPVDPGVKAPVILDLNVNGPLEQLINLGLDSRLSFGSGP